MLQNSLNRICEYLRKIEGEMTDSLDNSMKKRGTFKILTVEPVMKEH
jgi:hypothetical protein